VTTPPTRTAADCGLVGTAQVIATGCGLGGVGGERGGAGIGGAEGGEGGGGARGGLAGGGEGGGGDVGGWMSGQSSPAFAKAWRAWRASGESAPAGTAGAGNRAGLRTPIAREHS